MSIQEKSGEAGQPVGLRRSISLIPLALYGVGVTVGAGIYVLVGAVAGSAGLYAPLSFVLAALVITPTAFSFGELAARLPKSAGEAVYVEAAFSSRRLSLLVGGLVVAAGIISSAAVANGAAGYINEIIAMPAWLAKLVFLVTLAAVACWGVRESVAFAVLLTLIEVGALVLVVWVGTASLEEPARLLVPLVPSPDIAIAVGVFGGMLLAFFAFIGFEDMVNMAEEVHAPERTLPLAIILTLVVTSLIYVSVATVAVTVVAPELLAQSGAPLALVFTTASGLDPAAFSTIAVIATVNTVLIQIIMASRVIYGMAAGGGLPAWLGRIHWRTRTPVVATLAVTVVILLLALFLPLTGLARMTSAVTLTVFTFVNLALARIKLTDEGPRPAFQVPIAVPIVGVALSAGVLAFEVIRLSSG